MPSAAVQTKNIELSAIRLYGTSSVFSRSAPETVLTDSLKKNITEETIEPFVLQFHHLRPADFSLFSLERLSRASAVDLSAGTYAQ